MYEIITVNAGHSPKAVGASGNGYQEHVVAREIKDKLIIALKTVGQKCFDTTSDASTKNEVLAEQVRKCNSYPLDGRLDVSIHLNSGGGTGTEVFYITEKSLSAQVSQSISDSLGIRNRGAKLGKGLWFLEETKAPAILIEICFIDSADDMIRLFTNMGKMVESIVEVLTGKRIEQKTDPKSGSLFRVVCGSYADRKNAEKRMLELKAKGFDSFIDIK